MFLLLVLAMIILVGVEGFYFSSLKSTLRTSKLWGASDDNFEKLFSMLEGINHRFDHLEERFDHLEDNQKDINDRFDHLEDAYGDKWIQASDTYEILARENIKKKYPDAKMYTCQTLQQLAEICLPMEYDFEKGSTFADKKKLGAASIIAVGGRVQNLIKIAEKQIGTLVNWLASAKERLLSTKDKDTKDELKRKTSTLQIELDRYLECETCLEKTEFLRTNRLGFFAYSTVVMNNQSRNGFIEELEIDFLRPSVLHNDRIVYYAGEIKFGRGSRTEAILQVLRRVGVCYMAGKHVLGDNQHKNFQWSAFCQIANRFGWFDPIRDEIEDLKIDAGILEYPPYINVVMETFF